MNKLSKTVQWDRPFRSAYDVNNDSRSSVEIPTPTIGGVFQISEASPEQPHRQRLITKSKNGKLSSSFVLKGQSDNSITVKQRDKKEHKSVNNKNIVSLESTECDSSLEGANAAWPTVDKQKYYMDRNLIHKVTVTAENFDKKTTAQGQVYFVNRVTGQTTWNDPSMPAHESTASGGSTDLGPLPVGWEMRTTQSRKKYFVDHNSRTTQFAGMYAND